METNINKRVKEGSLKFIGFCSEETAKLNKNKGYIFKITKNRDIVSECFGTPRENVYIYKEITIKNK